jgi:5-formyltetrahydrofolate cyclo-ligase
VGFTTQYVTGLPRDPHDQRLNGFLSEDGVIARFETTKR